MATVTGGRDGLGDMLQHIALGQGLSDRPDADLLEGFIATGDGAAFEALIRRHGPMVLGVCRRILGNEADAEDAFQATFLVLVRKARSVSPRSLVGHWLYGVASKTARKARAMSDRRRSIPAGAARPEAVEAARNDWSDVLDDELARLPEKYRIPVVLCELQGLTLRQAAEQIGCPQGTVASRLARGRDLLARRMGRQGLAGATPVAVPGALLVSTANAAALFAAGNAGVPVRVAALAEGVLKVMLLNKLRAAGALLVVVALACTGGLSWHALAGETVQERPGPPATVRPQKAAGRERAAAPPAVSGRDELKALAKKWADRGRRYTALVKNETSDDKVRALSRRLLAVYDPRAVEAFFDLEKRYRGQDVGLFALNFVVMRASQVGDPDMAVVIGRERALKVLRQHYLAHQELDILFPSFRWGPLIFGAEELLDAAARKSPFEHVRASALLHWAELLHFKVDYVRSMDRSLARKAITPREWREWEQERQVRRRVGSFDEPAALRDAERLAKRVLAEYPKTVPPRRVALPDEMYMPRRTKEPKFKGKLNNRKVPIPPRREKTYAEYAEALLFDMGHLAVDRAAPEMEGRDADGKKFRLADCKGKVVVLMFSANWCGPCKGRYPGLRELQKRFKGKPVEVVTVMADRERDTVRKAIDKGDITWRAVCDGEDGPIATRWNVHSFPTLYVLDQAGIIRGRDPAEADLADLVAGLLKKKQPSAAPRRGQDGG